MPPRQTLETVLAELEEVRAKLWKKNAPATALKLSWRASAVKHSFHILPGQSVLEFGAGDGTWTARLSDEFRHENPVTGAVFSDSLFDDAQKRNVPSARFVKVNDLDEDLPAQSFDYVIGSMILFHELLPETLLAVRRLLKPGGQIIFFEHNHRHPFGKLISSLRRKGKRTSDLFPSLPDKQIVRSCSHQGFTHIELAPYDFLPWGFSGRVNQALQAKALLFEHAPYLRSLSEGAYLWARVPGAQTNDAPNLAHHESLKRKVSVVIPCHNEQDNVRRLVSRIFALYESYIYELILVNDNSTDGTQLVAEALASEDSRVRVIERKKPNGVGLALKDGYKATRGEYILSLDCDFVEILPEFRGLFDAIAAGHDGAIGSRFSHDSILINYPFAKMVCNRAFHLLIKLFLVSRARDLSNNLKLYRAEIFKNLRIDSPHFSANLETGLKPVLAGYDIVEVPISWINRTVEMGSSSFKVRSVGPDYAWSLLRIAREHWKQKREAKGYRKGAGNSALPSSLSPPTLPHE